MNELRLKMERAAWRTAPRGRFRCRTKWIQLFVVLGILSRCVLGCDTVKMQSRKAPGVDLSKYRTFTFAETRQPSDLRFLTPTNEARIKAASRTELEQRGLRMAEPADLVFYVYLKTTMKTYDKSEPALESGSLGGNLGTYFGMLYDNSWGTQDVVRYPEGTLVVQAVDVKQNRKVWEGIATGVLYRGHPEPQVEARIHEAVSGMFKGFPKR